MEVKRFFAKTDNLKNDEITLLDDEFFHLNKVLRYKVGFKVIISLDDGYDYYGEISKIEKDHAIVKVLEKKENETKNKINISLYQAIPKKDKVDIIAQKSCELGCEDITFFDSSYSQDTNISFKRVDDIIKNAAKQCGRSRYTKLQEKLTFDEMISDINQHDLKIVCYENEDNLSLHDLESDIINATDIALVIGSEGGFNEKEIEKMEKNGFKVVTLGKRILRCESAAISALAILNYILGEM